MPTTTTPQPATSTTDSITTTVKPIPYSVNVQAKATRADVVITTRNPDSVEGLTIKYKPINGEDMTVS